MFRGMTVNKMNFQNVLWCTDSQQHSFFSLGSKRNSFHIYTSFSVECKTTILVHRACVVVVFF